ncbi:NADH-cytochrome b5 reductase [Balamuthia mandrillaris]
MEAGTAAREEQQQEAERKRLKKLAKKERKAKLKAERKLKGHNGPSAEECVPPEAALSLEHWTSLQVIQTEHISPDTKLLRFALPSSDKSLGLPEVSCVVVRAPESHVAQSGRGPFKDRPYSPTSTHRDKGYFDLIVKTYEEGKVSSYLYNVNEGDHVDLKARKCKFLYRPNNPAAKKLILIAGGTGIAPMFQIIKEIASNPDDETKAVLLFSNKTQEDILLRKELDHFAALRPDHFQPIYTLTRDVPEGWTGERGRVDASMVARHCPPATEEGVLVMVCGPSGFYKHVCGKRREAEITGVLGELGFRPAQVFKF